MKIFDDENFNKKTTINVLILIMVLSGIFGFIYETFFYRIDLGYFVKRGSSFGPWIPIYAFGGLFITLFTYKYRKNGFKVFLVNCIITGILEYFTGFVLDKVFNTRLWDYNTEIWNWGNINGYICARSILFFGISSLALIYFFIPLIKKFTKHFSEPKATLISYTFGALFALDVIIYFLIH